MSDANPPSSSGDSPPDALATPASPRISPTEGNPTRSHTIAEQKRSLATRLKKSNDPDDHAQARTQEVQADQIEEEAREQAEADGAPVPGRGKLP